MVARITLEYDDQTAAGFQKTVRAFESSEAAAIDLAAATEIENNALARLEYQQMATRLAIEANTAAVHDNRRSFAESFNTLADFGRNLKAVGDVAIDTGEAIADKLGKEAMRRGLLAAAGSVVPPLKAVSLALLATKAASFAAESAFSQVGQTWEATGDKVSEETKQMVSDLKNGLTTVKEITEATGKSLEELGIRTVNQWTRIEDATTRATNAMKESFKAQAGAMAHAVGEITGLGDAYDATKDVVVKSTTAIGESLEGIAILAEESFEKTREHATGISKAEREAQAEMKKRLPLMREIQAADAELQRQLRQEQRLREINAQTSVKALEIQLEAEKRERDEIAKTVGLSKQAQQEYQARIEALYRRIDEARRENSKKEREAIEESMRMRAEMYEKMSIAARKQANEEHKIRLEAADKERRLNEAKARGEEELALHKRHLFLENFNEELKARGGFDKQILENEKRMVQERAALALSRTKDEEEKVRIRVERDKELMQLDSQNFQEVEEKKRKQIEETARKAAQEREKALEDIRGQKDSQGKNLFEQKQAEQSKKEVFDEILRERLERAKEQHPDLGRERSRQLERSVRQDTMRDAMRGQIKQQEVIHAQKKLAVESAKADGTQGQFNSLAVQVIQEQAQQQAQAAAEIEQVKKQLQAIQNATRNNRRRGQLP